MKLRTNGPALVSLGVGIGAIALTVVAVFVGTVPVLNLLNWLVGPLQLVLAFAAVVSGIVGFRTASALYGVGRGAAVSGFALGLLSMGVRVLTWVFGLV